jgi:hypothetical protein
MTSETSKKKVTKIIWILCILIILGMLGIPKLYQNYHSAPYYGSNKAVVLEDEKTHRLNKYQKRQFIKIAKKLLIKKMNRLIGKIVALVYRMCIN